METSPIQSSWLELKKILSSGIGPESSNIQRWLGMIRFLGYEGADGEVLVLGVPNRFVFEWIEKKYLGLIQEVIRRNFHAGFRVQLRIDAALFQELRRTQGRILGTVPEAEALPGAIAAPAPIPIREGAEIRDGREAREIAGRRESSQPLPAHGAFTLGTFVTGPANQPLRNAIQKVLDNPGSEYNPLFIYGPTGVGKSHLLQAIHYELFRRPKPVRSRYYEGEKFLNHFVLSLKDGTIQRFRDQVRSVEVFILDDFQLLANKQKTQEEFLHAFDALTNSGSQVIIASTQHPRNMPGMRETLVSRCLSGLVVELQNPDFETRMEIIRSYSHRLRITLEPDVQAYIAETVRGSVREILGALNLVSAHVRLSCPGSQPDQPGIAPAAAPDRRRIQEILDCHLQESARRIHLEDISEAVSRYYRVEEDQVRSGLRIRSVSAARHVAIFLGRRYTSHSLAEIGKFFGNRNYSTARSSEAQIRKRLETDSQLRKDVQTIQRILEAEDR